MGTLTKISDYLGVPIERFVMDDTNRNIEALILNADEIHILSRYRGMSEQDQELVFAMVDLIASKAR